MAPAVTERVLEAIAASRGGKTAPRRALPIGSLLLLLIAAASSACTSADIELPDSEPEAWPVHRFTREGPGEKIGEITLTDPAGGPPRPASIGTHGIRILFVTGTAEAVPKPAEVRVIYSRQGAADTRAFVAVENPGQPGVYLGTVDLVAAGEWRVRVSIVDGGGGSAQIIVPGR